MAGLHFVRGLLLIGLGTSLISGTIGALWFEANQGASLWPTLRVWVLSDLVGILTVTPVLAAWSRFSATRTGGIPRNEFMLGLLAFVGVLLSTYLAFDSEIDLRLLDISFSSTYVPLFFIALVTLLWGGRGGALSVAVLALMAFVYNSLGQGPFAQLVQLQSSNALLELQVYLAVAALLSLLISALKTTREQLHEQAARWKSDVEVALTVSRQLIYRIDPAQLTVSWSGDVDAMLGVSRQQVATLAQVLALVHPLDQERLRQRWLAPDSRDAHGTAHDAGMDEAARTDMPFRLQLADGRVLMATDMSRSLRDAAGQLILIAGAWHLDAAPAGGERGR
jgi:PAS domain-containing protein